MTAIRQILIICPVLHTSPREAALQASDANCQVWGKKEQMQVHLYRFDICHIK
jgi:hypothetical protein